MRPGAIVDRVDDVEKLDKIGRRTFGLYEGDEHRNNVAVNIAILDTQRTRYQTRTTASVGVWHIVRGQRESLAVNLCNQYVGPWLPNQAPEKMA